MAYENLCMYCFEELGGNNTCPHCGRDAHAAVPQIQMLPGTLVYHDRFLIGRALGQDATGIVYAAFDTKRENKLRIREYLPRDCAERTNDGMVVPIAGMEDRFDAGLSKLRASVEGVEDPRKRHFFFEENGTAYIVQRKSAAAAAAAEEPPEAGGRRRVVVIAVIAALVVIAAAVALISIFNGALNGNQDVTENPTLDPNQVWVPVETPTVTPYVSPTFAALVDPDLSWMDYTYSGDVEQDYQTLQGGSAAATATPRPTTAPTLSGDASGYGTITGKSSQSDIRALQQKLVTLGWLDYTKISGQYDSATRQAVRDFQNYINSAYNPSQKLTVDGIAGPKTQQWLYQVNAVKPTATPQPTPSPTPKVTAAPSDDTVVDENSTASAVRALQRDLIVLGVLPEGSDNGSYDSTTRAAVRRFQTRVNQLQGYEVLEVTGRMDALSMAFLDYYVEEWRALQSATAAPTDAAPTATAAPTNTPAAGGDTVNASSSRDAVRALQRRLIAIGLLPQGADDGVYGSATTAAVRSFQQWVNAQRNEETLAVSGEADALTVAYLKYCEDNGVRPTAQVTATPTAAPTPTQAPDPTIQPTAVPADEPEGEPDETVDVTIDSSSDRDSIRRVQEMLADVGLMSAKGVDGVYGKGTTNAVKSFQQWVNAQGGALEVSGVVDNATREALEYYSDRGITVNGATGATGGAADATGGAAAEPTLEPTAVPETLEEEPDEDVEITVGEDSDPESISFVQQMLTEIGALDEGRITGVYDADTQQAVVAFQQWFNRQGVTTLNVTGQIDNGTRQMLEYCFDHDLRMTAADRATEAPTEAPTAEPTEAPTEAPTPTPTVNPDDPFGEPDDDGASAAEAVEKLSITVAGALSDGGVTEVSNKNFTVGWTAEGSVQSYYVYVSDSAGNPVVSAEGTDSTSFTVDTSRMNAGEVYTVTVGALPKGGTEEDILWQSARFVLPAQPTAEPTATPTAEPEPVVGTVGAPSISIGGTSAGNGAVVIADDSFLIQWSASGDVQSYNVQIADANGNLIAAQYGTSQTELTVRSSQMQPGAVYTISVGAIPENGGEADIVWSRGQFTSPAAPTATPTPEPTEVPTPTPTAEPTPAPTVASVGAPSVTVGGAGYQQDGVQYMTDSTIIVSWGAEGDVANYVVYVENQSGERQNLGATTDTSRTVSAGSLPAGVYTVYVGAIPSGGTQDDAKWGTARFGIPAPTPEPTEVVTPIPETAAPDAQAQSYNFPIDGSTDSDTVQQLQMKLYRLGVMAGEPEQGVLDKVTLEAVAEFQSRANEEYGAGLTVLDPSNPNSVVDVNTLSWISRGL